KHCVHAPPVRWLPIESLLAHPHFAGAGALKARDNPKQSRFARSTLTEDGEKFSFGDVQRNIPQHHVLAEVFGHAANPQQRGAVLAISRRHRRNRNLRSSHRSSQVNSKPEAGSPKPEARTLRSTAPPLLHSKPRCTCRAAAHSARNRAAFDSYRHHRDAGSLLRPAS